jgi:long-chain acyl-CoA synthetase
MFMESDVSFCLVDMGCLMAGLVDVPIYVTHAPEQVQYVIDHAGASALVVSTPAALRQIAGILPRLASVRHVVVASGRPEAGQPLPHGVTVLSLDAVQARGRERLDREPGLARRLAGMIEPEDLATIIYTSGTTGRPKGVMLSHQNISHNALSAFSGMTGYRSGPDGEVTISFCR